MGFWTGLGVGLALGVIGVIGWSLAVISKKEPPRPVDAADLTWSSVEGLRGDGEFRVELAQSIWDYDTISYQWYDDERGQGWEIRGVDKREDTEGSQ